MPAAVLKVNIPNFEDIMSRGEPRCVCPARSFTIEGPCIDAISGLAVCVTCEGTLLRHAFKPHPEPDVWPLTPMSDRLCRF